MLCLELGLGGNCLRTIQTDRVFWSFRTLIKMRNKNEVSYIIIFTWFSSYTCTKRWNTFQSVLAIRANWCLTSSVFSLTLTSHKLEFDPNTWSSSTPNPKRIGVRAVLVDDFIIAWPMLYTFTSDWIKTRNSFWRLFGLQFFAAMSSILG